MKSNQPREGKTRELLTASTPSRGVEVVDGVRPVRVRCRAEPLSLSLSRIRGYRSSAGESFNCQLVATSPFLESFSDR